MPLCRPKYLIRKRYRSLHTMSITSAFSRINRVTRLRDKYPPVSPARTRWCCVTAEAGHFTRRLASLRRGSGRNRNLVFGLPRWARPKRPAGGRRSGRELARPSQGGEARRRRARGRLRNTFCDVRHHFLRHVLIRAPVFLRARRPAASMVATTFHQGTSAGLPVRACVRTCVIAHALGPRAGQRRPGRRVAAPECA
jgi:hypothetical protein